MTSDDKGTIYDSIYVQRFLVASIMGAIWESGLGCSSKLLAPIYGFGSLLATNNFLKSFCAISLLELLTGSFFNENYELWDYRDLPLNIAGHYVPYFGLAFTIIAILFQKVKRPTTVLFLAPVVWLLGRLVRHCNGVEA